MENIIQKIQNELDSMSNEQREELMKKLRVEIDDIDRKLVELLNERTKRAVLIGRIKKAIGLPTYNPEREKAIAAKIKQYRTDPLTSESLIRIYERIIDESRSIQKEDIAKVKEFSFKIGGKVKFKYLLPKRDFIIVGSVFIIILSILYFTFFTANHYGKSFSGQFDIKMGETVSNIAERLYEFGVIPSKTNFKMASFIYGAEKNIRAARYRIPNNLSYLDLLDLFLHGKGDFVKEVKIFNGVTTDWIAQTLYYSVSIDSSEFVNLANNREFLDSIGIDQQSAEGYLLPKKYYIYDKSTPREVIGIFYDNFQTFFDDNLKKRTDSLGLTVHQVLTLASIIQGESNNKDEMKLIAAVYSNRMRLGMMLQADPTVQFIVPGKWRRLLRRDLRIDSPYNTYKYSGLPPGPINNPGKDAILAALYPAEKDYLYFVVDKNGGHKFSSSYNEHLKNVNEYRKWINTQRKN
ncbi:MAG: endolytic transglycosylase MltG [Ignavibacteriaceae bacterium]|nr:endolytic transglycosylase MltG [Ignavibacteriaceae bacterium]